MTSCSPFLIDCSSLSTQPIITLVAYNLHKIIITMKTCISFISQIFFVHTSTMYTLLEGYLQLNCERKYHFIDLLMGKTLITCTSLKLVLSV